jgi:photosystem II stability/assembly factor-like uncharacterized protein
MVVFSGNIMPFAFPEIIFSSEPITIISPNGNEVWNFNALHEIKWSSEGIDNIRIEYTTDKGDTWKLIIPTISALSSSYYWLVPEINSQYCKIRISRSQDSTIYDESDNYFIIGEPLQPITVITPNGEGILEPASLKEIKWRSSSVENVKIEYTTDSSQSWNQIVSSISANTGSYYWLLPNITSDFCKIKISDTKISTVFDESDNFFRIGRPVSETEPNNIASQANTIKISDSLEASINPTGDVDYYKFSANAGDTLTVIMSERNNSGTAGYLLLFDANGNQYGNSYLNPFDIMDYTFIIYYTGDYYLRFSYSWGSFPNKAIGDSSRKNKNESHYKMNSVNSVYAETGDYKIKLKRFEPTAPRIEYIYNYNTYYNKTVVQAGLFTNGLNTSVIFDYGTSTEYGDTVNGYSEGMIGANAISSKMTGLTPGTLYHVRGKATNSLGSSYSEDNTFITPDMPENWEVNSIDNFNWIFITDVSFANKDIGFAVAGGMYILKTTNGGKTWDSKDNYYAQQIFCIDTNTVFALLNYDILKTTNGGVTWTNQNISSPFGLVNLFFTNADTGIIIGGNGTILRTIDGGITWTSQNSGVSDNLYNICFVNSNIGYVVGDHGIILKTTDAGISWNKQNSGTSNYLQAVCFVDSSNGYVTTGNVDGKFLKTTNGGISWDLYNTGANEYILDISFMDINHGIAVGPNGLILLTTDQGMTWETQKSGTYNGLYAVAKAGDNWVIVGDHGTILKSSYKIVSTPERNTIPSAYELSQNYPNPFNPSTTISYSIPSQSFVTLKVYDILGNEVITLVNEEKSAGRYEVKFKAENIASGVYFYQIKAENFSDTKKFVLMK